MKETRRIATAFAIASALFAACNRKPWIQNNDSNAALAALGSTVPVPEYGYKFWQGQHDQNTDAWREAVKLCSESILANYPNCLPINEIVPADTQKQAAKQSEKTKHEREMWARGYDYDKNRKLWFPFQSMISAGCSYSGEPGARVFDCPAAAKLPKGEQ